jgi:hypothetical protein
LRLYLSFRRPYSTNLNLFYSLHLPPPSTVFYTVIGSRSNFSKLDLRPFTCPSLSRATYLSLLPIVFCVHRRQPLLHRTSTSGFLVATTSAWSSHVEAFLALVGLTLSPPVLVLLFCGFIYRFITILKLFCNFFVFSCVSMLKFSFVAFESFLITVFFVVVLSILQVCCNNSLGCTIYSAPSQTTSLGGQVSWLYQEAIGRVIYFIHENVLGFIVELPSRLMLFPSPVFSYLPRIRIKKKKNTCQLQTP